jgi:hypothetical protein
VFGLVTVNFYFKGKIILDVENINFFKNSIRKYKLLEVTRMILIFSVEHIYKTVYE